MKIIKRDGRQVDFNPLKIQNAILLAFREVDGEVTEYAVEKATNIADYIKGLEIQGKTLTVEEIQDLVEKGLMSTKRKDVAKAYILYRDKRDKIRTKKSLTRKAVIEKLKAKNPVNQNANVDERSFGGRMGEANSIQLKEIALDEFMSEKARFNHLNNIIYTHDLDSYAAGMHNCLSIPFDKLLANGFKTRQTDVRPAGSVNTAFQLVAVIFQLQSLQQFGGVSATHLDWTMVPYVRKSFYKHFKDGLFYVENYPKNYVQDLHITNEYSIEDEEYKKYEKAYKYAMNMTIKEVHQAVEGLYHNLNTLQSRSGNQLKWMAG